MHFKRLELYGFKSFAEKTELEFEPGITAVVGPNGCGKSNITDAIKWVLGEQSARELRGLKMEDVIFNGTSLKEPVNFTEVSLTLSNEGKVLPIEYEEIIVTRRLFRSGESEYLLNKTSVRLKDIQELFMGTGIGISAYSLLEQGKIDLVLSSKAEDRRFVFEEAAGITKFKSQKREALRRLEDTANNLLRVNDIIAEVKRQISSIERQARKAERYQEVFNAVKERELKINKFSYLRLESQLAELEKERTLVKEEEEKLQLKFNDLDADIQEKRDELEHIEQDIATFQGNKVSFDSEVEKNLSKINLDKERIKELEARIEIIAKESKDLGGKIAAESKELIYIKSQFDDFIKSEELKRLSLKEKQDLLNSINHQLKEKEAVISSSKISLFDVEQGTARLRNELIKIKTEAGSLDSRFRRLEIEREKTSAEKVRICEVGNEVNKLLTEKKAGLDNSTLQINKLQTDSGQINETLNVLNNKFHQLDIEAQTLGSRIEFLEELKSRYEGYSPAVKSFLTAAKSGQLKIPGIVDVLANLIETDKGYEQIVEVALGDYVQTILVKDYQSLRLCLEYVQRFNPGGINFMVLEDLENIVPRAREPEPNLVYLKNFVRIAGGHQTVLEYLLGNTILAENLEEAIRLAKEKREKMWKWVTSKGECVEYNIIRTAAVSLNQEDLNIIGRDRRIKELQEKLVLLEKDKNETLEQKNSIAFDLEKLSQQLQQLQEARRVTELEIGTKEQEYQNLQKALKKLDDELALLALETDEINDEIRVNTKKIKENNDALMQLQSREEEIKRLMEEANSFIIDKNNLRENTIIEIAGLETELKASTDRAAAFKERISALESSLEDANEMLTARENEKTEARARIHSLNEEISSLEKNNLVNVDERERLVKKIAQLQSLRSGFRLEIDKAEEVFKKRQADLDHLRKKVYESEMKIQEINFNKKDIMEKTDSSYKVNLGDIDIGLPSEEFNYDILKQELDDLKGKLEAMGAVNLVVIEEHRELQERHNFLISQQEDLNKAKESLHEAINKINRTTKELFMETFQKIEVNFKEIFRLLFGGGNAQILLVDSQDVLESGIEIIAQPPGKKLQNISLLSGGEKALTAVSLLFAIFKVKPSPFCIMDEVDAPLDEANIDRFRMLLKEFARSSQFIVITHNKKTITIADVMYGITMEESGVSKIVSVKFSEANAPNPVQ
jgi:chromosome segregation protein